MSIEHFQTLWAAKFAGRFETPDSRQVIAWLRIADGDPALLEEALDNLEKRAMYPMDVADLDDHAKRHFSATLIRLRHLVRAAA
jgi:hypothetical protein